MMDFFWTYLWPLIIMVVESVVLLVVLLVAVAYVLLADRKIWAAVQIRRGPNVVGPWGLFQSFADLLKFVVKEPVIPAGANKGVFLLAPLISCVLALAAWAVIPVNAKWVIADRFREPAHSSTVMMTKPIETSYDTICAAERTAARNAYFEFDAQPAMMMP
jgi:NADH-quinone oxidoreductase subunit H